MDRRRLCCWGSSKGSSRYDVLATWEERAFAEDSAGDHGSVWPPKSYSCTFCSREFRSAQALGGHMNVHRRDRASLKLSQSGQTEKEAETTTDHHPNKDRCLTSSLNSSRTDPDLDTVNPRVSTLSELPSDKRLAVLGDRMFPSSPYWSQLVWRQEENKGIGLLGSQSLVYPTIVKAMKNISDTSQYHKLRRIDEKGAFARSPLPCKYCINDKSSIDRAKMSESCTLPRFPLDRLFAEGCSRKPEVSRGKAVAGEELDLELRLGSPHKVK
ncbi:hypothetical protein MLD38_018922 [Melastoma candidum]|uniref:Uncharacterized protein n=1 Tax=Melastoma candidum TaxID=119954 RepID=A0ACB9R3K9_9MYRT|nr:hypothetical protein MLD38_018922 [Melastoma candidum]